MFVSIFDQNQQNVENLGGKGYGLWEMAKSGLPVPPALVIPTNFCVEYMSAPKKVMGWVADRLEEVDKFFVDSMGYVPLRSVRSGARVSMPGMMDTILNVGLHDSTLDHWKTKIGDACATDSYERLIEMYGSVVDDIDRPEFDGKNLAERLELYEYFTNEGFPDPKAQMLGAIEAVFKSWNNERAKVYRKMHQIPEDWGTAVVIQAMVFGNYNDQSATGVLFTRNPDNGLAKITGEFLVNAQGEDVVAGIKTPQPLEEMDSWNPTVYSELCQTVLALEESRKDVQDVEFTIQDGKLYILQTRNAKRSAPAAVKIALDMVQENMLTPAEAVKRVSRKQLSMMQQPVLDPKFKDEAKFKGIAACSGVVTGKVVRSAEDAINCKEPCILVTKETTPDDIAGMVAAKGVVTMQGGSTSHAAVVARSMNKPCIVGVSQPLSKFPAGMVLSIDGESGRIWAGEVPVVDNSQSEELQAFCKMMYEVAGCELISDDPDEGTAMLDLTDFLMTPDLVLEKIKRRLAKNGDFIVDVCLEPGTEMYTYVGMFSKPEDQMLEVLTRVKDTLTPKDFARMTFVAHVTKFGALQLIARVDALQDLILAGGRFLIGDKLGQESKEAVEKVMAWKKAEGQKPVMFGVLEGEGSYLSKEQVLAALLP